MRTRKKKWTARELAENPLIMEEDAAIAGRFSRGAVQLEAGCGKGRFITGLAARDPGTRYVAIERDPTILAAAARLAKAADLHNVTFVAADARALPDLFAPGDITRLYINFCDPWPRKKKWAKRRLTHENFLCLYEQLLIPEIHFKTDSRVLFEASIESFSARRWRLSQVSLDLHSSGMADNIMTEYEAKFSAMGLPIYRLEARRIEY